MAVDVVMCGAAGRMGRRIMALAAEDPSLRISAAVESPGNEALGRDAGELAGLAPSGVLVTDDLEAAMSPGSVTLDFTHADVAMAHARKAAALGRAIVIGTSGVPLADREELAELAKAMPCMLAPNMSVGVNVLLALVEDAVRRLGPDFDTEIFEIHHNRKKDAPSGTAIALAETAAAAAGADPNRDLVLAREGMVGERRQGEIGVVALRGGDNVGEHTVMLVGAGERLELTHRAASRDCLAAGALRAARWLADKPNGLYSMRDAVEAP